MNEAEQRLASSIYQAIQDYSNKSDRSLQSAEFRVGVSDLGFCSEYTKRMLQKREPEWESDALAAFVGTAVGEHVEHAVAKHLWPTAVIQSSVTVVMTDSDGAVYRLPGHPDVIVPEEALLIDVKTVNGLDIVRRTGPKPSQQYQRHCYAKAAWEDGLFGDVPIEDVRVANVWIDRSGADHSAHVHMEPYSEDVVREAADWLSGVLYGYVHDTEVPKEPSREFCQRWCGHFSSCRALDTDVEGLLTDPEILAASDAYEEALELERRSKRLKAVAKGTLQGVSGSTGKHLIRWVHVNGGEVTYNRQSYDKLDVRVVR